MTPFEIFFGLSSVILGLALAEIASSITKLLRAGRNVRWAPEPILQTVLITLIVVYVWADQWWSHTSASFTVGQAVFQVAKLMALYVAAASVLGEPEATTVVDLKEHYYSSRRVTYGALVTGLLLFISYRWMFFPPNVSITFGYVLDALWLPTLYVVAAIVRWRLYHIVLLVGLVIRFAYVNFATAIM